MPSDYELSEAECSAIAKALSWWLKVRGDQDGPLTDYEIVLLIGRLGREQDFHVRIKL